MEKQRDEEQKLLESVTQTGALISASEIARGVKYEDPIVTGWRPPGHIRNLSKEDIARARKRKGISVEGDDVP